MKHIQEDNLHTNPILEMRRNAKTFDAFAQLYCKTYQNPVDEYDGKKILTLDLEELEILETLTSESIVEELFAEVKEILDDYQVSPYETDLILYTDVP